MDLLLSAPKKDEALLTFEASALLNPIDWKVRKGSFKPIMFTRYCHWDCIVNRRVTVTHRSPNQVSSEQQRLDSDREDKKKGERREKRQVREEEAG